MGTAGKEYAVTVHNQPGDTQTRVIFVLPPGCQIKPKARAVVEREGEAPISEELVVEVAA
jgi:hypothetical protein